MDATYITDGMHYSYVGNPLIEALPQMLSEEGFASELLRRPRINIEEALKLPGHLRQHDVRQIGSLYVPTDNTTELAVTIDVEIRQSLFKRSPFDVATQRYLDQVRKKMEAEEIYYHPKFANKVKTRSDEEPSGTAIYVLGPSGMGKSSTIKSILNRFPAVIEHSQYQGKIFTQKQLVWISVDAPVNGAITSLCAHMLDKIDQALGFNSDNGYAKEYRGNAIGSATVALAQIAATHFLGLLHIDDLQRCLPGKGDGTKLLEFAISLANIVRCPLLISGTSKVLPLFEKSFEAGRRIGSGGGIEYILPKNSEEEDFTTLLEALFKFQLLDKKIDIKNDLTGLAALIFELTRGIPAVTVALYRHAHADALRRGSQELDRTHFFQGYKKMKLIHAPLEALRTQNSDALEKYEDLLNIDEKARLFLVQAPSFGVSK